MTGCVRATKSDKNAKAIHTIWRILIENQRAKSKDISVNAKNSRFTQETAIVMMNMSNGFTIRTGKGQDA